MPLVRYLCDRVAVMQKGQLVEMGDCEQICDSPKEAYTRELIGATPEIRLPKDRSRRADHTMEDGCSPISFRTGAISGLSPPR